MDVNKLLKDISNGNISSIRSSLIASYGGVIPNSVALNILTAICKLIRKNDTAMSATDLYDLIILCCKNLSDMNDSETEKYLLCVYHITKYLCTQKSFENAFTLFEYVKRHCVNKNFKNDMYSYYIILFNNEILQMATNFSGDVLHNIVILTLKMQTLVPVNRVNVFFSRVRSYCPLFKLHQITQLQRKTFCLELLKILKTVKMPEDKEICDEAYKALLNVVNLIIYSVSDSKGNNYPSFVNNCLEKTFRIMRKLCVTTEYTDCTEILEQLAKTVFKELEQQTLEDPVLLNDCYKKLKSLIRMYGRTPSVMNTCSQISKAFRIMIDYFQNDKDTWEKNLQPKMQVELVKICDILGLVLSKNTELTDKCCNKCSSKTDMYQAATVTSFSVIFSEVSVRLNLQCLDELHQVTLRCLKSCCEYVRAMKEADCKNYLSIWRVLGTMIYNTSIVLYRNKCYNHCKLYCRLFYKNAMRVEGFDSSGLCFANCLGSSLHLYSTCFSSMKQNKEAMVYLSIVMVLYPTLRNKSLQSWIVLKSNLTDDDELKAKTVKNILEQEKEIIIQLLPDFTYKEDDLEEILMCELRHYVEIWPSKVALHSVCHEICLLSSSVKNKTIAFVLSWEKVIHVVESHFLTNLEKTIDLVANSGELDDLLYLSCLNFVLYQKKMHEVINKNVLDMNVANLPVNSAPSLKPYEEPPNPNDKCDIVPAYFNLKIENLLPLFEILDKCLELCGKILHNESLNPIINLLNEFKFGEMIKQIAYEYRLQHFQYNMLRSWYLYLQFGKLFDDKIIVLSSIGFILEHSDCNSKISKTLELEAEKLIPDLISSPNHLDAIITYYINKSAGYLRSDLIEEGYSILLVAEKYKEDSVIDMELDVVDARLLHLKTCYLTLPCKEKIMYHNENFLNTAQNSFAIIAEYYKNKGRKCPYLVSILLDIALSNGTLYKWLHLPREVRCYTKESILLAQKLVLPIKTAQFLSLLAFADLLDKQFDDCEVKLTGLTKILSYGSMACSETIFKPALEPDESLEKCESFTNLNYLCATPMFQSVLDVPVRHRKVNNVLGSPDLRSKPFVVPGFVKHATGCTCYKCLNFEYQKLVLDSVHLESILNSYQGFSQQAQNYFMGGLMLHEQLRKKSKTFSPVEIKLGMKENVSAVFYKTLLFSSCAFLLDYSYFLTRKRNLTEAQTVVDNILNLLKGKYQTNEFLWNEIWVQKLNLICDTVEEDTKSNNNLGSELQNLVGTLTPTTPENKISQPKMKLSVSPCGELQPIKAAKKIIFKLFDSEEESDSEKPKTPVVNKNQFFKIQTPAKTPAPFVPKIKVYSPKTVKSKRCKTLNAPKTPSVNKTDMPQEHCKSEAKVANSRFAEQRMKLLTEKLKAETKGILKDRNTIEEPDSTTNKLKICKNLLDELEDVTDGVGALNLDNKKTTTKTKAKENTAEVVKTKKTGRGAKTKEVVEKKRIRIKIEPVTSSESSSEEIGIRRSVRNKTK